MFPMYKDMNPHPYQSNQTPSPQFYNPTWETFPSQIKENQANPPQMHEHWPQNYPYPTPMSCQNCCTHGQHPSYYNFRPPCPPFPSPSPYGHYYGFYPTAFPPPYPYIPPPPFPMEMPRYDYDKGSPKPFHCCECPNHPSHFKSTNNVKIEEHDPDIETSKAEALVPTGVSTLNNSPYPIMWVPPGYVVNKEQPKKDVVENGANKVKEQGSSLVKNPSQSIQAVEKDPKVEYQWFPLDMNSIKRLMEGGEVMKPQDQEKKGGDEKKALDLEKKDQNNKQFSYPFFWMPHNGQKEDHVKGQEESNMERTPPVEQEERSKGKQPVDVIKHPDKELLKERILAEDPASGVGNLGNKKTGKVRVIPVKQLDDSAPNSSKKELEIEVKGSLENAGKMVKVGNDMKPSCPTRKSKLPPICLRVDPPRKKNGKGSSRLPSPPNEKNRQESCDSKGEEKDKELRVSKEEIQAKELVKNDPIRNEAVLPLETKEDEKKSFTREHHFEAEGKAVQDSHTNESDGTKCVDGGMHTPEQLRKILSVEEAAFIIQSAYRGYAVRRWEPLKKLRQIANVREEAGKVRSQIKKLESCVSVDNKEKVVVGETIMNLLLKLDALQGLHSSIRDIRRSVAKELVMLQEKLDCIESQQSDVNPITEGAKELSTGINSEENATLSPEIVGDSSKISEQGEAFNEVERVEAEREFHNEEVVSPDSKELAMLQEKLHSVSTDPYSSTTEGVQQHPTAETVRDASIISEQGEASNVDGIVEAQKERFEVNEEPGREPYKTTTAPADSLMIQNQLADARPFEDTASQFDMEANQCEKFIQETVEEQVENDKCVEIQEEMKEKELEKPTIAPDNSSMEPSKAMDSCDKDQEADLAAESSEELVEEQVESDIARMDWECDLSSAKITPCVDQEPCQLTQEIDEQVDGDARSAFEVEKVEEKHVQAELHGEVMKESERETFEAENPGERETFEAENPGANKDRQVVEQPNDMSELQYDDFLATENDHHVIAETCDEENLGAPESETTNDPKCTELRASEHEVPVIEVEKEVIKEGPETEVEERSEKLTNGLLGNLQAVCGDQTTEIAISDGCKEDVTETSSTLTTNGEQIERRIIEENEKLRNMVEKLLASGKEQQDVISNLTAKVNDLEKKLPKRNKVRSAKRHGVIVSRRKSPTALSDEQQRL